MRKIYTALLGVFLVLLSLSSVSAETFKIDEVDIIELDIIELVFTRELDASLGAIQEFILEEQSSLNEIEILLSEVNPDNATRLTLMLGEFLEEETDYTITVLDIKDSGGNTIEAGIDSIFTFNTGRMTIGNNNQEPESSDDSLFEDDMLEEEDVLIEDDLMNNEEDELDVELNAAAEI
ncbi:Ig-like domain-containing protein [Candidatus Gracilibacteria bacterium]|nr:Ig-like domain-containing protein [Candidatus Gracilibacteria bacterium]